MELEYEIQDLFKTSVYKTTLSLDNKALASYCLSMAKKDKGRIVSNVGGWQSGDLQEDNDLLKDLFFNLRTHGNHFIKSLGITNTLKLDNAWININGYKDTNQSHIHPGAILSGVYYVQTPKDCGNIHFYHPAFTTFQFGWNELKNNGYNSYNSAEWFLPAVQGNLYIFPGLLYHRVEPNYNKKEKRISISFNMY